MSETTEPYAPGAVGTLLLDRVKSESETFATADREFAASKSDNPADILAVVMAQSDKAEVIRAREAIAKAQEVIAKATANCETLLKDEVNAYAKNSAVAHAKVKEIRKNISDLVNAGELAEPGFREYVNALNLAGVKSGGSTSGKSDQIRPRVQVSINGTLATDDNGKSTFTVAAKALKVNVTDLQQAWIAASGKSDAKEITDPVTFTFAENEVTVTKR